jgi:predicted nucleic acid-binding protein
VSNAGPLIHLAKAGSLSLLKALYGEIIIPLEVKMEVVDKGKERGFSDAIQIEDAINEGWIKIQEIKPSKRFSKTAMVAGLQIAEIMVVHHAYRNEVIALLDDEPARVFARTLGIQVRGSLGVLLECLRRHIISREETLQRLDRLSEIMYFAPEVYRLVRREIERV